jgi:peroxiredoxin Q/BCP
MRAPIEKLADQSGRLFSWKTLKGKAFVLYFYPRDKTSGCAREACDFRDRLAEFTGAGVEVIGVSPDSVESYASFSDQHGLNFTLISDPDHRLAKAYGTWTKKKNYGREYMGIDRSSFVVDAHGIVRKVFRGVRVPGHVDRVLEAIGEL